jgi:uncharacterized OsmC-like protein
MPPLHIDFALPVALSAGTLVTTRTAKSWNSSRETHQRGVPPRGGPITRWRSARPLQRISGYNTMNSQDLRATQAPIKELYKEKPEAALITLKAQGRLGEGITCKVQTGKALIEAGLHPATGGDGLGACSGDMLLDALVACAGVTLGAVSTAMGIGIRGGIVRAEGDLDFRGTLGVVKDVPVGFTRIRINFDLDTDATEEQMSALIRLTERYCVVYQTLRQPPEMLVSRNTMV